MGNKNMCISGPGGLVVLYCSCTFVTYRELHHGREERITLLHWRIAFQSLCRNVCSVFLSMASRACIGVGCPR